MTLKQTLKEKMPKRFTGEFEVLEDHIHYAFKLGRRHGVCFSLDEKAYQAVIRISRRKYRTVTGELRNIILTAIEQQ